MSNEEEQTPDAEQPAESPVAPAEPDSPSEEGNRPPPEDPSDDPASNPPDELDAIRGG